MTVGIVATKKLVIANAVKITPVKTANAVKNAFANNVTVNYITVSGLDDSFRTQRVAPFLRGPTSSDTMKRGSRYKN